jgi:hypothetical protein
MLRASFFPLGLLEPLLSPREPRFGVFCLRSLSLPTFLREFRGCRPDLAEEDLPALPEIKDKGIRTQVFTHRSYFARQTRLFEDHPGMDERPLSASVQASRLF